MDKLKRKIAQALLSFLETYAWSYQDQLDEKAEQLDLEDLQERLGALESEMREREDEIESLQIKVRKLENPEC